MNKNLLSVILFIMSLSVTSQSNMAQLKYEEAEDAYRKNNFVLTISKLDEAESMLKSSNPKTQYLRILAQEKMIAQHPNQNFELLDQAKKNCMQYLINHENNSSIEEQYANVYKISEKLKTYPSSRQEFDDQTAKLKSAAERYAKRPREIFDSLCAQYRFKSGLTEKEFKKHNEEAANLLITKQQKVSSTDGSIMYNRPNGAGPLLVIFKNGVSYSYGYTLAGTSTDRTFGYYNEFLKKNFAENSRTELNLFGAITSVTYDIGDGKNSLVLTHTPISVSLNFVSE